MSRGNLWHVQEKVNKQKNAEDEATFFFLMVRQILKMRIFELSILDISLTGKVGKILMKMFHHI